MSKNKQETSATRRHRPFYKLPLFWFSLIIVAIVGVILVPKVLAKKPVEESSSFSSSVAESRPTETTSAEKTDSSASSSSETSNDSDGKTPAKYDGADANLSESLTGSLTTARFDAGKLILRVSIDQYLPSGTCSLEISDGGNNLEKSANIAPIASTSSCEGFDVLDAELSGFSRPLTVKIKLSSGDRSGVIEGKVE